ncbi:MAG: tetratricopeptide repeat protein, partial [Desulfobulbaceae bacterium]
RHPRPTALGVDAVIGSPARLGMKFLLPDVTISGCPHSPAAFLSRRVANARHSGGGGTAHGNPLDNTCKTRSNSPMQSKKTYIASSLLACLLAATLARATEPSPFALPQTDDPRQVSPAPASQPPAASSPFALPPQPEQPQPQTQNQSQTQQPEQVDPDAVFGQPSGAQGTAPPTAAAGTALTPATTAPPPGSLPAAGLSVTELLTMGTDLARQMKYDEARVALEKASALEPGNVLVLNNLGLVMRKLGRIEEATRAYTSAIQANPGFALTYKNYGILLEQNGEKRRAVDAYRRYCSLAPNAPDMQKVSQRADWLAGGL